MMKLHIPVTFQKKQPMQHVTSWMSWETGIDLAAVTNPELSMPNIIVHVARMVHTPVGSAPSGMILWQPDPAAAPLVMGFISTNETVGRYFGPNIFAGTPFEQAPVLPATFAFDVNEHQVNARIETADYVFELTMQQFSSPYLIQREPAAMPPFFQQGVELHAQQAELKVNGVAVSCIIPPVGISGGPASVFSPNGVYAR